MEKTLYQGYREDGLDGWDEVKEMLKRFFDENSAIAFGTTALWYGEKAAGALLQSYSAFELLLEEYVTISEDNGELTVSTVHHDGTSRYTIRMLTAEGEIYAAEYNWIHDGRLHETIFSDDTLSKPIQLGKMFDREMIVS